MSTHYQIRIAALLVIGMLAAMIPLAAQEIPREAPKLLDDHLRVDTVLLVNDSSFQIQYAVLYVDDQATYYYPSFRAGAYGTVTLHRIEHGTGARDTFVLKLPEDVLVDAITGLRDFAVSDRYIVLMSWRNFLVYEKTAAGNYDYAGTVAMGRSYESLKLMGDSCFVSLCAFLGNTMQDSNTFIGMIDVKKKAFRWEKNIRDPKGVEFMFFRPRSIIDFSGRDIVIADVTRYHLRFIDILTNDVVSITMQPERWAGAGDTSYRSVVPRIGATYHPKQLIEALKPFKESRSLIKRVDFLDDTTLLVAWQPTAPVDFVSTKRKITTTVYDIWKKRGLWTKVEADMESARLRPQDTFSLSNRWPLPYEYIANNSYLLGIEAIPVNVYGGKTIEQIGRESEDFYLENDFKYSLLLYRVK